MWRVEIELVEPWLDSLDEESLAQVVAALQLLQEWGPQLGAASGGHRGGFAT